MMKKVYISLLLLSLFINEIKSDVASCYKSTDATVGTKTTCAAGSKFCGIVVTAGNIASRDCLVSCTPSATQLCCSTDDCNDATTLANSCIQSGATATSFKCAVASPICTINYATNKRACENTCTPSITMACCNGTDCNTATDVGKTCFLCTNSTICSTLTDPYPCFSLDHTQCKTNFANGIASSKLCAKASECTASSTVGCSDFTLNTANKLRTCYVCNSKATCLTAKPTACPVDFFYGCLTTFDGANAVSKSCYQNGGIDSADDLCFYDNCNSANVLLSCYTCTTEAECNSTITPNVCPANAGEVCKTIYNENGKAQQKMCSKAEYCFPDHSTSCCYGQACNSANSAKLCFQCHDEGSCNNTLSSSFCDSSSADTCMSTFKNGKAQSKACVASADCVAGTADGVTTKCCTDDGCNSSNDAKSIVLSSNYLLNIVLFMIVPFISKLNSEY